MTTFTNIAATSSHNPWPQPMDYEVIQEEAGPTTHPMSVEEIIAAFKAHDSIDSKMSIQVKTVEEQFLSQFNNNKEI